MNQLNLFNQPVDTIDNCILSLRPDTDPSWIEMAFPVWDDPVMLSYYRADLESRLKDETSLGVTYRESWVAHMLHDIRDTIRVISDRINALQH